MLKYNKQGISLIETILSIAILSIGIISIATIFPFILKISKTGEQETISANLAQAKIEELFSLGYENIPIGIIETKSRLSQDPNNPFYQYQREVEVRNLDTNLNISTTETGLKRITVTVYYKSSSLNMERSLPISLLISQK